MKFRDNKYILAFDLGTSSVKAVLFSIFGEIIAVARKSYPMYHPAPRFAEQDPLDWWDAVCWTSQSILAESGIDPADIAGLTFASQTQCLLPVDKNGTPLMKAISWLDSRSIDIIKQELWTQPRIMGYNIFRILKFLKITGGCPGQTGKDQIGKLLWLRKFKPQIFAQTYKYLDVKDFIIHKLTGNFVTSVDDAVVWWFLDTRKNLNEWSPELCQYAGITIDQLPEVKESAIVIGEISKSGAEKIGLKPGTPVINGAGDLSAAALGSGATDEGDLHICIGTSGWVGGHFTKRKIDIPHYTGCIGSTNPQKYYLGMAHQEIAGACLEWLKNKVLYHVEQLQDENNVEEIFQLFDRMVIGIEPGAKNLIFTPWMFGERCPIDDDFARAGLYNLGLQHSREHIVRAVFEGVAFNTRWAMETLENLYKPVSELNIIGGGAKSDVWCQIFADVLNRTINQIENPQQAGSRGVALLASMTLGFIDSWQSIKDHIKIQHSFKPNPENREVYDRLFKEFKNLYKQNRRWFRRMNTL